MSVPTSLPATASPANAVFPVRRLWTRDEYYRMGELGWFTGQRVELIAGEVVVMNPQGSAHFGAVYKVSHWLEEALSEGYCVRTQGPLHLENNSEPEPDVAVVKGTVDDYLGHHPATALLVVEVSQTTLAFDRTTKASLYASAEVPEYWVLNLEDRVLEVHREPFADASQRFGFGYRSRQSLRHHEHVTPLATPGKSVAVSEFLL